VSTLSRLPTRRASWAAPQSLSEPHRGSALELPWIQTRLFVKSRAETRMWWISEVRAVASASAHAAGCLVAVSACSDKLRQNDDLVVGQRPHRQEGPGRQHEVDRGIAVVRAKLALDWSGLCRGVLQLAAGLRDGQQ